MELWHTDAEASAILHTGNPTLLVRLRRPNRVGLMAALALLGFLASACSDTSPAAPTPPSTAPTIVSITPSSGSTQGGTSITITGTNFAAGATVVIGGVAATAVTVTGTTSIQAVTGAHAAGATDVVVTVGSQTRTLAAGFTSVAPLPPSRRRRARPPVGRPSRLPERISAPDRRWRASTRRRRRP